MSAQAVQLDELIDRYPAKPEYLIFLLQDIQAAYGYISPEAMDRVCDHAGVPKSRAYSVATFYQSFSLKPKGEHKIRVCMGTACHLKGAQRLADAVERKLGIKPDETSPDLKFSLEAVHCLGACAMAPVVVVDDEYHAGATPGKLDKLLDNVARD
ncbi:NADH-quinone oxidoreductase, E subunit [Desulfarculus baarsii DSM 2075]|uniref:NADH-quinone oxidoreductase, E subunit n=1 Tax=Desulfarculus baarsii (strain ATCC 33931 / DSM 2075 / LMG 7858 / VKM B-1802 / 2st14) TaxID=644282 RepID=E1QF20_DESB2|nr:NAD(P)H-dependent oxidoreductase subunit E [Desulfarculus baarsii]ADK84156.1 NADH-quinone oxidoreductase, E subunit [Desulfarculus baarsii DSM 2075]